jgi:thioredoxin 1
MTHVILTDQNFKTEVLDETTMPVMVDFWAEWCSPCKIVGPIVEELATEYDGKIKIAKLNVDENGQTAQSMGIMSLPSILFFKNGQVVKDLVGAQSKDTFKKEIEEVLSA